MENTIIEKEIENIIDDLNELRQSIHRNPELGYEEKETTNTLEEFFKRHNMKFNRFNDIYGGYVFIDANSDKTIGFRGDIDALPILENTGLKFSSENKGVMHACGHDIHTTIAAGNALILERFKEKLKNNILIIFQPAEECNPTGGAELVMKEGIFEKYNITSMYGLHVWPKYDLGKIGVKTGPLMGSSDRFNLTIKGVRAHAAEPYKGVDAISIASDIVDFIKNKLHREINPFETALVSIGEFNSTGRYNVICDQVHIGGTIRTTNNKVREYIHTRIDDIANNIADNYGGQVQVNIEEGYSVVENDKKNTEKFISFAEEFIGEENVDSDRESSLIAEDFASYREKCPITYFFLGCESEYPLHSDKFLPKEGTIEMGINLVSNYLLNN